MASGKASEAVESPVTGHPRGHAQVALVVNGLRDQVQDGFAEAGQIRDIGLPASRLVGIRSGRTKAVATDHHGGV